MAARFIGLAGTLLLASCGGGEREQPAESTKTAVVKVSPAASPTPASAPPVARTSACLMQDNKRLSVKPLRAIGTEPFWGAQIEGRCVTYSHPEYQRGTRIWTRYTAHGEGGTWTGALGGRPFILRTRPQPGCSDGMSDRRYPLAVELTVNGEQRRGCAAEAAGISAR